MVIGKLQRVSLREVWPNEARDFTPWLQDNIDVLNELFDLTLSNPESEMSAGTFSVDLVAEDEAGNLAIIENQLEKSNHDHLGKLITYLTVLGAKTAIWIVADPRPEHVRAIPWLNESPEAAFYLVKVEAVQIADSPPAPLLTTIVGPSDETKEAGSTKKRFAERHIIRYRFWTELLDRAKTKTNLHANISPSYQNWIDASAGKGGLKFNYVIRQHDANVELYIDRGKDKGPENKKIFDDLRLSKEAIEDAFGGSLEWQRLEGKRACHVAKNIALGGYRDHSDKWPETQDALVDAMILLESAFRPYIARLTG